jgi:hypothetical protein
MSDIAKNLLRPRQVQESREELSRIEGMLNAPSHVRSKISDPRAMAARAHRLKDELDKFTPKAFSPTEKDVAVRAFNRLRDEIAVGMPSSEEMRRNPPGAVQKHQSWERRNKTKVLEWKNIGLRLQASGDLDDALGDAAINVELLRNHSTNRDLSMDGAQIPKATDYHFPPQPESVVLSDAQIATLDKIDPDLSRQLALMPAEMRLQVKEILQKFMSESAEPASPGRAYRIAKLRRVCKENGVNSFGKSIREMVDLLSAKGITIEG